MMITNKYVARTTVIAALLFGRGRTGEAAMRWCVERIGDSRVHATAVAVLAT